ncbi:hypothetical protein [Hyphomonas sp.]|uniref:hypothetical protein n=1 Tax=Hyphomonas sp. TaxID=87 RepID=UPI00391B6937
MQKIIIGAATAIALGLSTQTAAAQLGCLNVSPGLCIGNNYNEQAVINHYVPIYQALIMASIARDRDSDLSGGAVQCISSCELQYRGHVAACRNLPTNDPVIGSSAQQTCFEIAEEAFRACLLQCMQ